VSAFLDEMAPMASSDGIQPKHLGLEQVLTGFDQSPEPSRRSAIAELLFFASVGDLHKCERLVRQRGMQVREGGPAEEDFTGHVLTFPFIPPASGCRSAIPALPIMISGRHCESDLQSEGKGRDRKLRCESC
jgi:hypothetical protein